jgi:uncharacterized membrane protein HdeD (DUF308 family)
VTQTDAAQGGAYWPVPVVRAVPALILGLYITFSADHSARLGLVLFGAFALVSGVLLVILNRRITDRVLRGGFIAQGLIGVVFGLGALLFTGGGLGLLLFLLPAFCAITGFLELYCGLRARRRFGFARDWLLVGAFTAIAALVFLLIPQSALLAIGLLGAYGVILGVYLVIAGLSLRWDAEPQRDGPQSEAAEDGPAQGSGAPAQPRDPQQSAASAEAVRQQPAGSEF